MVCQMPRYVVVSGIALPAPNLFRVSPATRAKTFRRSQIGRRDVAIDTVAQQHFNLLLPELHQRLGSIPVFLQIGEVSGRLDLGRIGHAVAEGIVAMPVDGPTGYVEFLNLV